jgi:LuxR family quorum sensing-dependent transcriptional regulator
MPDRRTDDLLAFLARVPDEPDVHALIASFLSVIALYGFDAAAGGNWVGVGKHRHYRFFFNSWPQDWLDYYNEHGFFQRDFIVAESRRRMAPFTWAEMDPAILKGPVAEEFFGASRAHGWVDGFVVPVRGAGGYEGIVSLASKRPVELTAVERSLLEAASRALNERCRTTVGLGDTPDPLPALTQREIECLEWASLGKTDWEIGEVLGVTKATVHFHIEQAKRKLGVTSRVQAVSLLLLHGVL